MELLNECPTEDSTNCVWDATAQGNGTGQSFIDIDGTAYTLAVPEDHYILEAYSNTASPTGYTVVYQENDPIDAYGIDPIVPMAIVAGAIVASIGAIVVGYLRRS
jgi:hypothetical protein